MITAKPSSVPRHERSKVLALSIGNLNQTLNQTYTGTLLGGETARPPTTLTYHHCRRHVIYSRVNVHVHVASRRDGPNSEPYYVSTLQKARYLQPATHFIRTMDITLPSQCHLLTCQSSYTLTKTLTVLHTVSCKNVDQTFIHKHIKHKTQFGHHIKSIKPAFLCVYGI